MKYKLEPAKLKQSIPSIFQKRHIKLTKKDPRPTGIELLTVKWQSISKQRMLARSAKEKGNVRTHTQESFIWRDGLLG